MWIGNFYALSTNMYIIVLTLLTKLKEGTKIIIMYFKLRERLYLEQSQITFVGLRLFFITLLSRSDHNKQRDRCGFRSSFIFVSPFPFFSVPCLLNTRIKEGERKIERHGETWDSLEICKSLASIVTLIYFYFLSSEKKYFLPC